MKQFVLLFVSLFMAFSSLNAQSNYPKSLVGRSYYTYCKNHKGKEYHDVRLDITFVSATKVRIAGTYIPKPNIDKALRDLVVMMDAATTPQEVSYTYRNGKVVLDDNINTTLKLQPNGELHTIGVSKTSADYCEFKRLK